jgi:hypothetical protein
MMVMLKKWLESIVKQFRCAQRCSGTSNTLFPLTYFPASGTEDED